VTLNEVVSNVGKKWKDVAIIMGEQGFHKTKEQWRTLWRLENDDKYKKGLKQGMNKRDDKRAGRFDNEERLLGAIKRKRRIEYLEERLGMSEDEILSIVVRLQLNGYNVKAWNEGGAVWLYNVPILETGDAQIKNLQTSTTIKIAVLGDTHLGSKSEAIEQLNDFYDYCNSKGVKEFYHVGDISDGYYRNRDGSIFDQHKIGFQEQLEYIAEVYPKRKNSVTYFITGNHDATHINNGGANIGSCLQNIRKDMVYIGHNFAKIWLTDKIDMNLIHPADGVCQALSYKAQKIVDSATGKRKAKIMCIGHYHKMNYAFYKDTHTFLVPSFQWQTPFMSVNNLISVVGGYILTIKVNKDEEIVSLNFEFIDFSDIKGGE
jgi:UDP-2,3-diacylglucosamine pyrophosphatase LpxH